MGTFFNDLNNLYIDVLKEIGNIGSGNAITALAKMLNKKIEMEVPKVNILKFNEVAEALGSAEEPVVGIMLNVEGDITGSILFILGLDAARILINMLMASDSNTSLQFDDIELSALMEMGNILSSSYLTALSTLTNLKLIPSIPDLAIDMAGAILSVPAIAFGKLGETVLYIETKFYEGAKSVVGDFFLIPDIQSYSLLFRALGVIE